MDWAAATCSLIGVFLMGRKLKVSWLIFLVSNALWITHCYIHGQWAQLSLNVVFVILNILGYRKWSRDACNQTSPQSTEVSHVGNDNAARPQIQTRKIFPHGFDENLRYPKVRFDFNRHDPDGPDFSAYMD